MLLHRGVVAENDTMLEAHTDRNQPSRCTVADMDVSVHDELPRQPPAVSTCDQRVTLPLSQAALLYNHTLHCEEFVPYQH